MRGFTEFETISGRKLLVRSNASQRVYTIKTESATYKTTPMSKAEFEENEFNTGDDWQQFLNTGSYYKI